MSRKRRRSDEELEENPPKKMREIFWKVPKSVDLQVKRDSLLVRTNWSICPLDRPLCLLAELPEEVQRF